MENDFQIEKLHILATGGQSKIHLGRFISQEKNVVLKEFINADYMAKELCIASLRHENIIEFIGYWTEPNYLVFEFVSQGDLETIITKDYNKVKETPLKHFEDILKGLEYIHEKNIVHLDLHPKNILVDVDKYGKLVMKIADFGLSEINPDGIFPFNVIGRPGYVSPEKVQRGEINPHSDIWAIGSILWKLLTKEDAYNFDDSSAALYNIGQNKHPNVPLKWPVLIQRIFFQCWDSRVNATELLMLFENERIKRETENCLVNEMPLEFYEVFIVSDSKRIIPAIQWGNIEKMNVFKKYCFDKNEFENMRRKFTSHICKRKFEKIKNMVDLLKYLNENSHFQNLQSMNDICIGKVCEIKQKLVSCASEIDLVKLARFLGMFDTDISYLRQKPSKYFVDEIFDFWSSNTLRDIMFDCSTFKTIIKKTGIAI